MLQIPTFYPVARAQLLPRWQCKIVYDTSY